MDTAAAGREVSRLRRGRAWTQERLATESGVAVRTIQRFEAGSDVGLTTLSRIAEALDVPVSALSMDGPDPATESRAASAPDDDGPRSPGHRRRRWLLIGLGIYAVLVVCAALVLQIPGATGLVGLSSAEVLVLGFEGLLLLALAMLVVLLIRRLWREG